MPIRMGMKPILYAAAGLAVLGLLLAGCGGGTKQGPPLSKTQYLDEMKAIGTEIGDALSFVTTAATGKDAASALERVRSTLGDAAKELSKMTPPPKATRAHAQLTAAVSRLADQLDPVIVRLKSGNLNALGLVTSLKGFAAIQRAALALGRAGYDITA